MSKSVRLADRPACRFTQEGKNFGKLVVWGAGADRA
jgi:hypothetical protein